MSHKSNIVCVARVTLLLVATILFACGSPTPYNPTTTPMALVVSKIDTVIVNPLPDGEVKVRGQNLKQVDVMLYFPTGFGSSLVPRVDINGKEMAFELFPNLKPGQYILAFSVNHLWIYDTRFAIANAMTVP